MLLVAGITYVLLLLMLRVIVASTIRAAVDRVLTLAFAFALIVWLTIFYYPQGRIPFLLADVLFARALILAIVEARKNMG